MCAVVELISESLVRIGISKEYIAFLSLLHAQALSLYLYAIRALRAE